MPRVGQPGEPIPELTRIGWTVMSPGKEVDSTPMFLTQTSSFDYENLCRLDVLGLEDSTTGDQASVYAEFKEQLKRSPDGWYEVNLPWKGNHPSLPSNEKRSLKRLKALTTRRPLQVILSTSFYKKAFANQTEICDAFSLVQRSEYQRD